MADSASDDDRRARTRHFTCYPFPIRRREAGQSADEEIALVQDLSASGAYLLVREALPVGALVELHLDLVEAEGRGPVVGGRVVRIERRPADQSDIWLFGVAVRFDPPRDDIEPSIRALALSLQDERG